MNYRLLLLSAIFAGACNAPKPPKADATKLYNEFMGFDSLARVKPESAFYFYNKAASIATDSGYKGTWLQRSARLRNTEGDYFGSNETALNSLKLFDEKNVKHFPNISYNYDLLATNFLSLRRYDEAIENYDLAFRYADSSNKSFFITNKGVALEKKKAYDEAIASFESVLRSKITDTVLYARVISNLAKTRWLKNHSYPASSELHYAKFLREIINDRWGLNASYSHLSDYYSETHPDSALYYAKKMYEVAKIIKSADDQVEALQKLVRLSSGNDSKHYFDLYKILSDSINDARSNAKNQFAFIQYAVEEARADNLELEKDNTQKKYRISQQLIIIYSIIFLAVAAGIAFAIWYRKRKRIQDLQTKAAIRDSELKTSQKVHDVVANGLYRIMSDLEHRDKIEKEILLDNIEELYEQSRDISYENTSAASGSFAGSLNELLTSFATASTRILMVGNNEEVWKDVSPSVKKELEAVLQELMVNMKKHSKAGNVVLNFQRSDRGLSIRYKDDGVGLSPGYRKGNGMSSTENRISGTGGTVIFDSVPGKGLTIDISIPLNKTT